MYIQIVNFNLKDVSQEDFAKLCEETASDFAALPGLLSKVYLADSESNTYGGVYTWQDRQAMEDFAKTSLFEFVATHPNLENITSRSFGILEEPTRVTRGLAEVAV